MGKKRFVRRSLPCPFCPFHLFDGDQLEPTHVGCYLSGWSSSELKVGCATMRHDVRNIQPVIRCGL